MFDIKEQDILGQTNRLLFNIWQELNRSLFVCPKRLLFNIWQELKAVEKPQKPQEVKPVKKPVKRAKKKTIKKDGGKNGI